MDWAELDSSLLLTNQREEILSFLQFFGDKEQSQTIIGLELSLRRFAACPFHKLPETHVRRKTKEILLEKMNTKPFNFF